MTANTFNALTSNHTYSSTAREGLGGVLSASEYNFVLTVKLNSNSMQFISRVSCLLIDYFNIIPSLIIIMT